MSLRSRRKNQKWLALNSPLLFIFRSSLQSHLESQKLDWWSNCQGIGRSGCFPRRGSLEDYWKSSRRVRWVSLTNDFFLCRSLIYCILIIPYNLNSLPQTWVESVSILASRSRKTPRFSTHLCFSCFHIHLSQLPMVKPTEPSWNTYTRNTMSLLVSLRDDSLRIWSCSSLPGRWSLNLNLNLSFLLPSHSLATLPSSPLLPLIFFRRFQSNGPTTPVMLQERVTTTQSPCTRNSRRERITLF